MFKDLIEKLFTPSPDKIFKKLYPLINNISSHEERLKTLDNDTLFNQTVIFRKRLAEGESLNDILPEAFATVREVSNRILKMRHFDVQLMGGFVLHSGKISEMKTGEGKTLVATLPMYLNAIEGKGAHLITVNDYLARRDASWMAPIYLALGLSVGIIQSDASKQAVWDNKENWTIKLIDISRKQAYACDITYGTNNEFGFDYLRDNMKYDLSEYVQRELHYAIVDEVDSILIDEARTPLIISGPANNATDSYYIVNNVVKLLKQEIHYTVDEKRKSADLTDEGINFVEAGLKVGNLYDIQSVDTLHFVNNALRAHAVYKLDVDYVVQNGEVIIVDEFTGRLMPGRRYSDGLHQALEAKEGVQVQNENQTYASITFQNYFRMYEKLSGMTGTALTEANEFKSIYDLEVVPVPTHRKVNRIDRPDVIYRTAQEKYEAIVKVIEELHKKGQPVLVGTISIEKSELLSHMLQKAKIKHEVLNAKNHEREAEIVAHAGEVGAVTIATNMAGRGTDIKLGEGVQELGGLFILGTERHESRRIDNQLRGRSGRQGDNGESRFYLSTEDDLLRKFGAEKLSKIMSTLGLKHGEEIESSLITKTIESAQKKVEAFHFEMRKHLLEYDNVANAQRKVVYGLRSQILQGSDIDKIIREYASDVISALLEDFITPQNPDYEKAEQLFERIFGLKTDLSQADAKHLDIAKNELTSQFSAKFKERQQEFKGHFEDFSKYILINTLDNRWKQHLLQMDHLRDSVGLRGYGQKDPLIEYKREAYALFIDMMDRINRETVELIMKVQIQMQTPEEAAAENARRLKQLQAENNKQLKEKRSLEKETQKKTATVRRNAPKIGRNDPCPCGSGKKYKNCHGVQG